MNGYDVSSKILTPEGDRLVSKFIRIAGLSLALPLLAIAILWRTSSKSDEAPKEEKFVPLWRYAEIGDDGIPILRADYPKKKSCPR